jgi:hypothetical protein
MYSLMFAATSMFLEMWSTRGDVVEAMSFYSSFFEILNSFMVRLLRVEELAGGTVGNTMFLGNNFKTWPWQVAVAVAAPPARTGLLNTADVWSLP